MDFNQQSLLDHLDPLFSVAPETGGLLRVSEMNGYPITLCLGSLSGNSLESQSISFPIYSIAKTILAVLAIEMVGHEKLKLDTPIGELLKREIPDWLKEVSLRNLLSHRSGLFDYGAFKDYHEAVKGCPQCASGKESFTAQVFEKGPQFKPGESFFYSNTGYMLIREILEFCHGEKLQKLFDEKIGSQLNISMECLDGPSHSIMSGYSPYLNKACPDTKGLYDFSWVFHGTFRATLDSLSNFYANLEELVGHELFSEMTNLHSLDFPHPDIQPSYGLGLMGDMNSSFGPVYGHNGGGPGFSVASYVSPLKGLVVTAIVNRDSSVEAEKVVFETLKQI